MRTLLRIAVLAATLAGAQPVLAAQCDPTSGGCPPESSLAPPVAAVTPVVDLRPAIHKLESELATLKRRPVLSVEQNIRLQELPSILTEMKKAQAAVQTAATSANKSERAAAGSAAVAVKASAESSQNASVTTSAVQQAKTISDRLSTWLLAILVGFGVIIASFFWVQNSFASFRVWVRGELAKVKGRIIDLEDRYEVQVSKINNGPYRTLLPAEIRVLPLGNTFSYFIMVDGQLARYQMSVVDKTKKGTDVLVVCEQITTGVTSRTLHKVLCERIENHGGMHPFVALAA